MMRRIALGALVLLATVATTGCSVTGAAMTGMRLGKNYSSTDSHLKITLDGKPATQDMLKKTVSGHANFTINDPVSTSPTLRFEILSPESFGRITMVQSAIHQQFEADYSHQAEFTIFSKNKDPQAQMKPNTDYALGAPSGQTVHNLTHDEVPGVTLKPGMKYMMSLTVVADRSETAQIYFTTK